MSDVVKACNLFLKLFPGWEVRATDALGRSRGLLCIWKSMVFDFDAYFTPVGILLGGRIKGYEETMKIINCYDPYKDREVFSDNVVECGLLKERNIILGGDLNFTLSLSELWGT